MMTTMVVIIMMITMMMMMMVVVIVMIIKMAMVLIMEMLMVMIMMTILTRIGTIMQERRDVRVSLALNLAECQSDPSKFDRVKEAMTWWKRITQRRYELGVRLNGKSFD
ncbi:lysine decarboxylase, putative [Brugia malayi]|uniref:Lysine decarboxylase, putative n=1 Tax=Brugia malayi TaxID=6279 RepID=A0A4E9F7V9_BRUMA|nr:lysine decarboxylase, putative [Brugia malayi]VIO92906.1 lysine decarboxylase, putative [Brugia malayi]